ncbi:MAG: sulfatase-like hydrolase/transferase [Acidobacteriota bacterium]|nr:sulfatase-like hydrolase/transferase [Acidobacteriota bacterium]
MRSLKIALLAVVLIAGACRRVPEHLIDAKGTPIILISIDTLRSDHLPAYGYTRIETPALDGFRADSILYEHAYSHAPLTLVSHASLFTGLLPSEHGIRDNIGYSLNPKVKTLAGELKSNGYATGGAVSAIVLRGESGIKRGFDFWDDEVDIDPSFLSMGRAQRAGDETREVAQKWIGEHKSKPFFFFFHIYEPHSPYDPPEPFKSKYGQSYDGDVAAADAVIGRFLDYLRAEGIYDRATIILVSDHGEGLGDHGEDEHGVLLYRETLQVPLMVKLPKSRERGKSVATPVQLIDVFPTILNRPAEGRSLIATLRGDTKADRPIYSETYYPRFHFGWSDLHSMISSSNHYIQAPKPELYDLGSDPAEKKNVIQDNRRTYVALRNAIAPYIKGAEAPKAINPEQAQQLAALGYIGSTVSTAPNAELPDPKDHIGSSGKIKKGFLAFQEKRYEDANVALSELIRENPNMLDIVSLEARTLEKLGRLDEAIAMTKRGLRLSPTSTQLALMIANMSLQLNRLDEAEKHAKLAMNDMPVEAHQFLAQIALDRKDFARATAEANAVVGPKRDRPYALMLLGQIAQGQGKFEEALQYFDQASAISESKHRHATPMLNFFRGDALARLGRADEAEQAFRTEIEKYPSEPRPYKNLILLYATEGKNTEATQLIFSLEKAAPTPPSYVAISETLKIIGDRNGARFWAARGLSKYPNDRQLQALFRG